MGSWSSRIPLYYLLLAFVAGCALTAFSIRRVQVKELVPHPAVVPPAAAPAPTGVCETNIVRIQGYAGIEPILTAERSCESPKYAGLRSAISELVQGYQRDSTLINASVYVRDIERGDWVVYNDAERYDPGSLLKVPVIMTYLRAGELDPNVMGARYRLTGSVNGLPSPDFPPAHPIAVGHDYSVPDLIHQSIAESDNLANLLLLQHMDTHVFERVFKDLSLPPIDIRGQTYPMGVRDYSMFMKTLFNASYLNIQDSEFAIAQLADCDFRIGLRAGVPASVKMAHKFGESGDGFTKQLHESAIVYFGDKPYILTVMTRGKDMQKLPGVLHTISDLVYRTLSQQ